MPEEIQHYGIKGMKWGVRRDNPGPAYTKVDVKNGKIGKVSLSETTRQNNNPSEDARRAAVTKAIVKTKSTDSLSNKELQDLVTRMNLEQQYSRLSNPQGSNSAQGMVKDILVREGKTLVTKIIQDQMTKRVTKAMSGG